MKIKLLTILFFFLMIWQSSLAQKIELKLDFTVTYLLPKSNDTIQVSFGENGKYLFTDSKFLVSKFSENLNSFTSLLKGDDADIRFMLNTHDLEMLFYLNSGKSSFLMNLYLPEMMPNRHISNDTTTTLTNQKSMEQITLMNKSFDLHHLFSSEKPEDKLVIAFEENFKIDYSKNFSELMSLILQSNVNLDFPQGAIIYLKDNKGKEVIKAIDITKESRTVLADLNFYIR